MHSIKELADILGLTSNQVRLRLNKLRPILSEGIRKEDNNKLLVDDNGLEILKRTKSLEEDNIPLNEIPERIQEELKNPEEEASTDSTQPDKNLIQQKERQIDRLKQEIDYLKIQIEKKDDQIQQLLPATVQEDKASPFQRLFGRLF